MDKVEKEIETSAERSLRSTETVSKGLPTLPDSVTHSKVGRDQHCKTREQIIELN